MKNKQLEFDLTEADEAQAFANAVRCLNAAGVPWTTKNSGAFVEIFIGDGY